MRSCVAAFAAAGLLAAAFFLPGVLFEWSDQRLLDDPHVTQQEQREGFAESVQLSVAEKLMLLRAGGLSSMALADMELAEVRYAAVGDSVETYVDWPDAALVNAAVACELEESAQKWSERLAHVQAELSILQMAGAMPCLWDAEDTVECAGGRQVLYIDGETQVSFLAYSMTLSCHPYTLNVTVDAKSGRILSFVLNWTNGSTPDWGFRGPVGFGSAWRDYWDMDSVSSGWNSDYIHNILEGQFLRANNSSNATADVAFTYDGQSLRIPLSSWTHSREGALLWNN